MSYLNNYVKMNHISVIQMLIHEIGNDNYISFDELYKMDQNALENLRDNLVLQFNAKIKSNKEKTT